MKIIVKILQERKSSKFTNGLSLLPRDGQYEVTSTEVRELSQEQFNKITDKKTLQFFRRLGGSETLQKDYTPFGYLPNKLISTSPDKTERKVYYFKYED